MRLWQSEVGAMGPQRHEPKVDPNSAEARPGRDSAGSPVNGSEMGHQRAAPAWLEWAMAEINVVPGPWW